MVIHSGQTEGSMTDVVYVSKSKIERKKGSLRIAYVAGEPQPVVFSVYGAIAEHYKVDPDNTHRIPCFYD